MPGMGLCCAAGAAVFVSVAGSPALAQAFSLRGTTLSLSSDAGFVQGGVRTDDGLQSVNAWLDAGVVWTSTASDAISSVPGFGDALAGSTVLGVQPGAVPPSPGVPAASGSFDSVGAGGPNGPSDPSETIFVSTVGGNGLEDGGGDNSLYLGFSVLPDRAFPSAAGVVNGVSGQYLWLGRLVVPSGASVGPEFVLGASLAQGPGTALALAEDFSRSPDGSSFAPFTVRSREYWWTVYRDGTVDGNDVYQLYISDVQVIPAPGALAACAIVLLGGTTRRRRAR